MYFMRTNLILVLGSCLIGLIAGGFGMSEQLTEKLKSRQVEKLFDLACEQKPAPGN